MTPTPKKKQHSQTQKSARLAAALSLISWIKSNKIEFLSRNTFQQASEFTFYKHLVSTVIRHKTKFEFYIGRLTRKPLKKLDLEVIVCLMLGFAQLEADSKVQAYAAINETVNLLSLLKKPYLKGFINGNLRSFSRQKEQLQVELQNQPLAIQTSHNDEFIARWENHFGIKTTAEICYSNNIQPRVQLVFNPEFDSEKILKGLEDEGYIISDLNSIGLTVANPAGLFSSEWAKQGAFLVQDRSFQRLNKILVDLPKTSVLDVCSAPGGKLIHLEWVFQKEIDLLVGCELNPNRLKRLLENIRHYQSKAQIVLSDALKPPFQQSFDLVLLDAPCSATGTIRKHPEIKWNRTQDDLVNNHKTQLAMLENCSKLVKPGGHLLYITCSLEVEENHDVIRQYNKNQQNAMKIVPLKSTQIESSLLTTEGFYQALPTATQMGCFAALLEKPAIRRT